MNEFDAKQVTALVLEFAMDEKKCELAIPNYRGLYNWEGDVFSVTRANYVHEFEIKVTMQDYKKDFMKYKHHFLGPSSTAIVGPNYFWYVTTFNIEPPEYAGWIIVKDGWDSKWNSKEERMERFERPVLSVVKPAPRLHKNKVRAHKLSLMNKNASFKLKGLYMKSHLDIISSM